MKTLRVGEIKWLAQQYPARKWLSWELNPSNLATKLLFCAGHQLMSITGACEEVDLSDIYYLRHQDKNKWLIGSIVNLTWQSTVFIILVVKTKVEQGVSRLLYSSSAELRGAIHSVEGADPSLKDCCREWQEPQSCELLRETFFGDPAWTEVSPLAAL